MKLRNLQAVGFGFTHASLPTLATETALTGIHEGWDS